MDPFPNHSTWNSMLTNHIRDGSKAAQLLASKDRIDPDDAIDQETVVSTIALSIYIYELSLLFRYANLQR